MRYSSSKYSVTLKTGLGVVQGRCLRFQDHAIINQPLATARAASCNGPVQLFIYLSVCLSDCPFVCRQNTKTRFSQKL